MSDRLAELTDKRLADERFLTHREEQELLRLQAEEIQRLRDEVAVLRNRKGIEEWESWHGRCT